VNSIESGSKLLLGEIFEKICKNIVKIKIKNLIKFNKLNHSKNDIKLGNSQINEK
jgi:hypothetical protein